VKKIRFEPNVPAEVRLRVGNHRVLFDETKDTITVHRIGDRRQAYR
jgi:mRNA-degrading endonuclease RelE of RelBE toxin-antitoxin system